MGPSSFWERRLCSAFLVLLGALSACTPEPQTSSETHFLCTRNADCARLGPGYSCVAGFCAVAATPSRDGGVRDAGAGGAANTLPDATPSSAVPDAATDASESSAFDAHTDSTVPRDLDATVPRDFDAATLVDASSPRGWGTPALLPGGSNGVYDPVPQRLGVAADGTAFATWEGKDATSFHVYAARYAPASGWGPTVQLDDTPVSSPNASPIVSVSANGEAMVEWIDSNPSDGGAGLVLRAAHYGSAWEPALIVAGPGHSPTFYPLSLVADGVGNFVTAWLETADANFRFDALVARYDRGNGWSAPSKVSDSAGGTLSAQALQLSIEPGGNAVVAWCDYRKSDGARWIRAARYQPSVGWNATETPAVPALNATSTPWPVGAVDGAGRAVLAWGELVAGGVAQRLYASTYDGTWTTTRVDQATSLYGVEDPPPQVVTDGKGRFMTAWSEQAPTSIAEARASVFTFGGTWSTPAVLDPPATGGADAGDAGAIDPNRFQSGPLSLAMGRSSGALVTWARHDAVTNTAALEAASFTPGSGFSPRITLSAAAFESSLTIDSRGNGMVAWRGSNELLSRRFDATTGWASPVEIPTPNASLTWLTAVGNDSGEVVALWFSTTIAANVYR